MIDSKLKLLTGLSFKGENKCFHVLRIYFIRDYLSPADFYEIPNTSLS